MSDQHDVWQEFMALPDSAQEKVAELVAMLKMKTAAEGSKQETTAEPLVNDPFVGMWRDHVDMTDSSKWVRDLRTSEW